MKEQFNSEVLMTTTHKKKEKAKVTFVMVLNKVMVGALILTTVAAGTALPAYADATGISNTVNSSATISVNYDASVENAIYNAKETVKALKEYMDSGIYSSALFTKLATQLNELDRAVTLSGKAAPSEVLDIIKQAEGLTQGLVGMPRAKEVSTKVNTAITMLKSTVANKGTSSGSIVSENRETAAPTIKLTDIDNHWGKTYIQYLVSKNAIKGYSDGTFKPNNTINKIEFLSILIRSTYKQDLPILENSPWYAGVLKIAYENRIVDKTELNSDNLNQPISRGEMAMMIERTCSNILAEKNIDTTGIDKVITDYDKVQATDYKYYIENVYARGIIQGDSKGNFNSTNTGTRAEASTMIYRVILADKRATVKVSEDTAIKQDPVVITEGIYVGRMRIAKATEYQLAALKTASFYKDKSGQCYVSVNLPKLPSGFSWSGAVIAYNTDGDYIFADSDIFTNKFGLVTIKVDGLTSSTLKTLGDATLGIRVVNEEGDSMLIHKLSTSLTGQAISQSVNDSTDFERLQFDTTNIFKW